MTTTVTTYRARATHTSIEKVVTTDDGVTLPTEAVTTIAVFYDNHAAAQAYAQSLGASTVED